MPVEYCRDTIDNICKGYSLATFILSRKNKGFQRGIAYNYLHLHYLLPSRVLSLTENSILAVLQSFKGDAASTIKW